MAPHTDSRASTRRPDPGRRRLLVGAAAAGAVWTTPSIIRRDVIAAATGSCSITTVNWTSVTGSSPNYTATGTSGTVTIAATITATLFGGATPSVFISGGQLVLAVSGHRINDFYQVAFSFTDSGGAAICTASTTVIDIDQNGRGLGCGTNSRFRDIISQITGPNLVTTPTANVIESPAGSWASNINCKTADTQNLGLAWSNDAGVTGAGFRYTMARPPGTSTTLDYQLVKVDPVVMCVENTGAGSPVGAPRLSTTPMQLSDSPDQD